MPLGDSITAGVNVKGGYRSDLWQFMSAGGLNARFVGSVTSGPQQLPERAHEGHPGWRIRDLDAHVATWLTKFTPEVILLHIGTNDILHSDDPAHAPARLGALIDHIADTLPEAQVYVATIVPLAKRTLDAQALRYDAGLSDVVRQRSLRRGHLHLVDMRAALTTRDISPDGIHPTGGGYAKMAAAWYSATRAAPMRRWEAEAAGVTSVNDGERLTDPSASGGGKVGYLNDPGSHLDFAVEAPLTGWHRVFVRAANGMRSACAQNLTINGRARGSLTYPAYGWSRWAIVSVRVWLDAGRDTLRFGHQTCAAELDSIDVTPDVA